MYVVVARHARVLCCSIFYRLRVEFECSRCCRVQTMTDDERKVLVKVKTYHLLY